MAVGPRAAWRRMRGSLAQEMAAGLAAALQAQQDRLAELEAQLGDVRSELKELRRIAETQVDVANELSELQGRLLRSATDRIDELEKRAATGP